MIASSASAAPHVSPVTRASILALLDDPHALPAVPPVAQQVVRLSEEDDTPASALARVISKDPALAGRLLRVANSAFFGFSRKVETVTLAVTLLGFRAVRNMVLALSLKSMFRTFGILERRLWAQSLCMGVAASAVAKRSRTASPEEAFVAGLLADAGQAVLLELARTDYQALLLTAYRDDADILALEHERLGIGHDEIGATLARRWNLPETLELTIRHHHGWPPERDILAPTGLSEIVRVAELLTRAAGAGRPMPAHCSTEEIESRMATVGLDPGLFDELLAEVRGRLEQDGQTLG